MVKKVLAVLGIAVCAACAHTVDHGAGSCVDYRPMCITGYERCETTSKGCTVCTCEDNSRTGETPPSNIPDPNQRPR